MNNVVHSRYLIVEYIVVSHKFSHTLYFNDNSKRIPIHNRIKELYKQGLGYRKIHRVLVKEKWKIGKSPTCVDTMIKKMKKRKMFLDQKTTVEIDKVEFILVKS